MVLKEKNMLNKSINSGDAGSIHYEDQGHGPLTLVFVHGWLGNCRWWDAQRDAFQDQYRVICLDLGGHGQSGRNRKHYSVEAYAQDISAVIRDAQAKDVILVGHSMSGSNVVEAFRANRDRVVGIVLVDTLQDLDQMMGYEQAKPFLDLIRNDFEDLILGQLSTYLFRPESPKAVVQRVQSEFLQASAPLAREQLEPFYKTDMRAVAATIDVPVRGINSTLETNVKANRQYFKNFDYVLLSEVGHYPMLERSQEFNRALSAILIELVRSPITKQEK
jgi:pimeloyl-ACP methyl ester carboxylesterase